MCITRLEFGFFWHQARLSLHTGSVATEGEESASKRALQAEDKAISAAQKKNNNQEARDARETGAAAARACRPQIVSWDIETTIPRFRGDGYQCEPQSLLVRPAFCLSAG